VLIDDLEGTACLVEQIAAQTRLRLSGEIPDGATRVVSLHDADARPIRKGRLGIPIEFGYKAQVVDNVDGIVVDHVVVKGNPPDAPMLKPAIERIKTRFGKAPRAVTAIAVTAKPRSTPTSRRSVSKRWPSLAGANRVWPARRFNVHGGSSSS